MSKWLDLKLQSRDEGRLVVAVDLDGTIFEENLKLYFSNKGKFFGLLKKDAKKSMVELIDEYDCYVWIYTVRVNPESFAVKHRGVDVVVAEIGRALEDCGIPFHEIYTGHGKPFADIFIDDRFPGYAGWEKTMEEVRNVIKQRRRESNNIKG